MVSFRVRKRKCHASLGGSADRRTIKPRCDAVQEAREAGPTSSGGSGKTTSMSYCAFPSCLLPRRGRARLFAFAPQGSPRCLSRCLSGVARGAVLGDPSCRKGKKTGLAEKKDPKKRREMARWIRLSRADWLHLNKLLQRDQRRRDKAHERYCQQQGQQAPRQARKVFGTLQPSCVVDLHSGVSYPTAPEAGWCW